MKIINRFTNHVLQKSHCLGRKSYNARDVNNMDTPGPIAHVQSCVLNVEATTSLRSVSKSSDVSPKYGLFEEVYTANCSSYQKIRLSPITQVEPKSTSSTKHRTTSHNYAKWVYCKQHNGRTSVLKLTCI